MQKNVNNEMRSGFIVLVAMGVYLTFLIIPLSASNTNSPGMMEVYEQLSEWEFSQKPVPVPGGGIKIVRENASWLLERGQIWLMRPSPGGRITGLVFEGQGRFRMSIPHWVEKEHLRRCSGKKKYNELDESFGKLLVRTPEPVLDRLFNLSGSETFRKNSLAADRHKVWNNRAKEDVDARVTAGLFNSGDQYLMVEMKTETFGWLAYSFDKHEAEEIQLRKFRRQFEFTEVWVSLDRESDRDEKGRPTSTTRERIDIVHQDIEADLTRIKLSLREYWQLRSKETAGFRTESTFRILENDTRVVRLALNPGARVREVLDGDGNLLPFIRKGIKDFTLSKKDKLFHDALWVQLDRPCKQGETKKIIVYYDLDIRNFVSGGFWYPTLTDDFNDRHTVRLTARMSPRLQIRAAGKRVKESVSGKTKISEWHSRQPVPIYGFTLARKFREKRLKIEGVPEVISFCSDQARTYARMIKNVAIDVGNSINFFQEYFNIRLPYEEIKVTAIESGHGQAFSGFLHLSEFTFLDEHPGASELFRAHEAAHFLWGHMVGWKTYRDQWLSEAFAEYSAMLFIQAAMPGKKHFREIIDAYTNEMKGSIKVIFSKYIRPWKMMMFKKKREKMGPIGLGYRASVAEVPMGYQIQVYHKGPLVLHMIRMMMSDASGSDRLFRDVLSEFLHTYKGKNASTADFRRLIEKRTKKDWTWFFDQWVHGTAIPTYSWNYKETGENKITVKVKQGNVPDGFKMPVPLKIIYKDGSRARFVLPVNKKENTFDFSLPKRIKKIVFNPGQAVLAKVRRL